MKFPFDTKIYYKDKISLSLEFFILKQILSSFKEPIGNPALIGYISKVSFNFLMIDSN